MMVQFDVIMALPVYINAGGSIREYINHDELYGRDDGVEMMIGMGLIWLLVVMGLIGAVAALWKYLRSDKARDE